MTVLVYWPGLGGGFIFDDYPNIVDNRAIQPTDAHISSLVGAALSSPSSELKRPLASLSFAINFLITGIDPFWMKLTNLLIHLLNGWLVFLLSNALLKVGASYPDSRENGASQRATSRLIGTFIAASWMLLPINLTAVLYVVQRMESMANLFVLMGLLGYVKGRCRMLAADVAQSRSATGLRITSSSRGFFLCCISITIPTAIGLLAKETAVLLPLYALAVEWSLFRFLTTEGPPPNDPAAGKPSTHHDLRLVCLFSTVLVIPILLGMAWLVPGLLKPTTWASRDFTLGTRLLSETRVVVDYIAWTLLPTPDVLSFYHDDFRISTSLLTPLSTLASVTLLAALITGMFWLRARRPLVALGLALFLSCQVLTATILPLELIYEHRNYFASFGLLLATIPLLVVPRTTPFALARWVLLGGLLACWTTLTALTSYSWGNPLRLAEDLAMRAPQSPRAQYELGRTYIIYSHYDAASPFTRLAYAPLERSAALPESSILPEQALLFMNARMRLPFKGAWWDSLVKKLKARKPGVQDESSLEALTQCAREHLCDLPKDRMVQAFTAGLGHPPPGARLLAIYGDYAWNVLDDQTLGLRMTEEAVQTSPGEAAYQITQIRMLTALNRKSEAARALQKLERLNVGGRLNDELKNLHARVASSQS